MNDHPNTILMKRAYDAFAAGDLATLRELMADDAVWHQPGHSSLAGDYAGREAILDFFGEVFTNSNGTFKAEPLDILADDERAMALQRATAQRDGHSLDAREVVVSEIRDGKVVSTQVFASDTAQEDTFWM